MTKTGRADHEQAADALLRQAPQRRRRSRAASARVDRDVTCSPSARAAASTTSNWPVPSIGLAGLPSSATRVAVGTSSRSSSSRFAARARAVMKLNAGGVAARPRSGWRRGRPSTGSPPIANTIGMVRVAALQRCTAAVAAARRSRRPAGATSSAAMLAQLGRSWPSAQRYSIAHVAGLRS